MEIWREKLEVFYTDCLVARKRSSLDRKLRLPRVEVQLFTIFDEQRNREPEHKADFVLVKTSFFFVHSDQASPVSIASRVLLLLRILSVSTYCTQITINSFPMT